MAMLLLAALSIAHRVSDNVIVCSLVGGFDMSSSEQNHKSNKVSELSPLRKVDKGHEFDDLGPDTEDDSSQSSSH